jgi:hypothetical protein
VVDSAEELGSLLHGTILGDRPVRVFRLSESDECFFGVDIAEAELMSAWKVCRSLLDNTERWPLAAGSIPRARRPGVRPRPGSMPVERGREAIDAIYAARAQNWPLEPLSERLEYTLNSTRALYGDAPSADEVLSELAANSSDETLDRWLLAWEEQRRPQPDARRYWHLDWFFDDGTPLMFLPARSGAETLAYLDFWGEQVTPGVTGERLATILEYWEGSYGAELVANWGTMLQFTVARPPATLDQAWELACDQVLIAPDTPGRPGTIREHARALVNRPTWFLHSRP